MTPDQCVAETKGRIGKLGGEWMFDPGVHARGEELGLDTWAWYHCGRGGVLGDPDPSVVVAAFGFFPPARQVKAWNKGVAVMPPAQAAQEYAKACAAWGAGRFGDGADRLADLLTTALDSASLMALPLFAGWLAKLHEAAGAPGPERLALALQAAREHRGGCHLVAVAGYGVDPLQAVMSGRYGEANAQFFGWEPPYPDPEAGREAMAAAERVTDRMVAQAYAVLTDDERAELAAGLKAL